MAKSKKPATRSDERKKLGNKASRIRSRQKNGKTVKPADLKWLAEWDVGKDPKAVRNATKTTPHPPKVPTADEQTAEPAKPLGKPPGVPESDAAKPPIPDAPKPPPGPLPKDAPTMGGIDWRKKYLGAAESREEQCQFLAGFWLKGLLRLNADIRALGGTPIVPDGLAVEMLLPAMVLTVDKFAPDDLEVDPVIVSALGSTVITGQRVYQGRTKAAKDKRQEAKDVDAMRVVQAPAKPSLELVKEDKEAPAEAVADEIPRKSVDVDAVKDDHEIKPGDYA